jgi:hypothetical protein
LGGAEPAASHAVPAPQLVWLPAPGLVEERAVPLLADPFSHRVSWRVELPRDGCRVAGQDLAADNEVGAFRQTLSISGRTLRLERATDLRQGWIEPADFALLREIALAEHRAVKRRLRVECPSQPEGDIR